MLLALSGCAHRVWHRGEEPIGKPTLTRTGAREYTIAGEVTEGPSPDTLAANLHVEQIDLVRQDQKWRTFETGRYDPEEAHPIGNRWLAGAAVVASIPMIIAASVERDGGGPDLGGAFVIGLGISSPLAIIGVAQHLAPSLPAARRNRKTGIRTTTLRDSPTPAINLDISLSAGGESLGASATDVAGNAAVVFTIPGVDAVQPHVSGEPVGPSLDIRGSATWVRRREAGVRDRVAAGDFTGARLVVGTLVPYDPSAWDTYCEAFSTSNGNADLPELTSTFDAPLTPGACGEVWARLDLAWAESLQSVAVAGELVTFSASAAPILAAPAGTHARVLALEECARASSTEDPIRAWEALDALLAQPELGEAARDCAEAVKRHRRTARDQAVREVERGERLERAKDAAAEAFYADNGITDQYGGDGPTEALIAGALCRITYQDFGQGCNLRENSRFRADWCRRIWAPTVAAGGQVAATDVLAQFCQNEASTYAYGYTYRGAAVDFSAERCFREIHAWCGP